MRNAYKILVEKPERKRPAVGSTHRREDNIKGYEGAKCILLAPRL